MKNDTKRATLSSVYRKKPIGNKIFLAVVLVIAIVLFFIPHRSTAPVVEKQDPPKNETTEVPLRKVSTYSKEQVALWQKEKEIKIVGELQKYFDEENTTIAIAVIKAESSMNLEATGYNCRYEKTDAEGNTKTYSASCKKGDEAKAWSIDCGIAQINYVGLKECPAETKELSWSVSKMATMHAERGWKPWSVYNSGLYKKYLD